MTGTLIGAVLIGVRRIAGNPWLALAAVLALAVLALFGTNRVAIHQRDQARAELVREREGRKADRGAYVQAQQAAAILAEQQRAAAETRYRQLAERADTNALASLDLARARAADYVAAQRLRVAQPGRPSSRAAIAPEGDAAQGADRPGADAVFLAREDFDIMVENTVRLQAVREWALGLEQQEGE